MVVEKLLRDGVMVLSMKSPPVNALGHQLRTHLYRGVDEALSDQRVSGIVIQGHGGFFSGGADITEFSNGRAAAGMPIV